MNNYTSNTYELKRDILNFSKKMSNNLPKSTQIIYQNLLKSL